MEAGARRPDTFAERHAWKVFLAISVIVVLFGAGDIQIGGATFAAGEAGTFSGVTGMTWEEVQAAEPELAAFIDLQVRAGGLALLIAGLLSAAICLTAFRRGERWAWVAMLVWPAWTALAVILYLTVEKVPGAGIPVPVISGSVFFVIAAVTLGLSYRKYLRGPT